MLGNVNVLLKEKIQLSLHAETSSILIFFFMNNVKESYSVKIVNLSPQT